MGRTRAGFAHWLREIVRSGAFIPGPANAVGRCAKETTVEWAARNSIFAGCRKMDHPPAGPAHATRGPPPRMLRLSKDEVRQGRDRRLSPWLMSS